MDKGFEAAINFLLYSYFKITLESETDTIIEKAIDKAYSDATNQAAFNALKKEDETGKEKGEATDILKKSIVKIFESSDFNTVHDEICKNLMKVYEKVKIQNSSEKAFTYGNAQKWLNMTMKYIYVIGNCILMCKGSPENANVKFAEDYKIADSDFWKRVHIPVDSYILESLWNDDDFDKNEIPGTDEMKKGGFGKYSSEKMTPWSQWEEVDYKKFWDHLSSVKEYPVRWEGPAWIEIAKKRNKK